VFLEYTKTIKTKLKPTAAAKMALELSGGGESGIWAKY
jgi:hypothetical protein